MPTTARRRPFWDQALRCFLSQTYMDSELVILDESPAPDPRTWPTRVRYKWIHEARLTTGRKRNLVNDLATTELIAHFDDDDWSHPERLERQVKFIDNMGAQVVGYHDLLFYRVPDRTLWCYYFAEKKPYATGTSMLYRRSWWDAHRFPEIPWGEDTAFWRCCLAANVLASLGRDKMIVARAHPGNTFSSDRMPLVSTPREFFPKEFLAEEEGL